MMHLEDYKAILFIAAFMMMGCFSETKTSDIPTISIDPKDPEKACLLSDIAASVKVVSLETNTNFAIEHFSEIIYLDNDHIIYKSGNSVILFDGDGHYKNKINAVGRGPHEYSKILEAYVDPKKKQIYIVDHNAIRIYNFDGSFVNKFAQNIAPSDVTQSKNGMFVVPVRQYYKERNRNQLVLFDPSFNKIKTFKSKNPETIKIHQSFMGMGLVYRVNDTVIYRNHVNDTIFKVVDTILKPSWFIDLGKYKRTTTQRLNVTEGNKALDNNKILMQSILESSNYFFIRYSYDDTKNLVVFDKSTKKCINTNRLILSENATESLETINGIINRFGVKNDLIKNAPAFIPNYIHGKTLVSIVNPVYLNEQQRELFNCTEDGNPVLFIATEKKFNK